MSNARWKRENFKSNIANFPAYVDRGIFLLYLQVVTYMAEAQGSLTSASHVIIERLRMHPRTQNYFFRKAARITRYLPGKKEASCDA